jgi:hypothetical protein
MAVASRPAGEATEGKADATGPVKRPYSAPVLTEYGSIGKLTRAGSGTVGEAGAGMMAMCL